MTYEWLDEDNVRITCTFDELITMDAMNHDVWATPTPEGKSIQLYLSYDKRSAYDFVIASVEDFCEAEGWISLGWEDLTEEERDMAADDEHSVEVSRWKRTDADCDSPPLGEWIET